MKWLNSMGLVALFIILCMCPVHSERAVPEKTFNVRVLLAEKQEGSSDSLTVQAVGGFKVRDPKTGSCEELTDERLNITVGAHHIRLNGRPLALDRVELMPLSQESFSFAGRDYPGFLVVSRMEEKLYLVNKVDIEDYVYCVLFAESAPSGPLAFQMAMATAIRTYVVDLVLRKRGHLLGRATDLFDIRPTNVHQTYLGLPKNQKESIRQIMQEAVRQTAGEVMVYNGKVITPMYDICCMNVPPSEMAGIDFKKAPWLERPYACHYCERSAYCKRNKLNKWTFKIELAEFERRVSKFLGTSLHVLKVRVSKRDKAGFVRAVQLETNKGVKTLSGQQFYGLFKKLRSTFFSVERKGRWIVFFNGRGFGHGVGLCVWGLHQMAKERQDAFDYHDALRYYFVGIEFAHCQTA